MLLIEPDVPEERHREVIERVQQIVEKGKGSWGGVEPWGRRKLAYEIKHTGEAWYYVLTFDAPRAAAFTASGPPPEADEETAELRLRIDETRDRIRRRAEGGELFGGEAPPPRDAPPQAG